MENMHFENEWELNNYLRSHTKKVLGDGKDGQCILLDNGIVCKKLWLEYYPNFVLQFKDTYLDSFVFARSAAIVDDFARAIFMEYVPGKNLYERRVDSERIDVIGTQLDKVVTDVNALSEEGVLIKDFHCGNIIHDGNMFKIVDTLPYLKLPKGNYQLENQREVMNKLYDYILQHVMKYRKVSGKFNFYGRKEFLEAPSYYFGIIQDYLQNLTGEEINTFEEANMSLKKKYKDQ